MTLHNSPAPWMQHSVTLLLQIVLWSHVYIPCTISTGSFPMIRVLVNQFVHFYFNWSRYAQETEYKRQHSLDPNSWTAFHYFDKWLSLWIIQSPEALNLLNYQN